jgi:hypothetical protein
MEGPDDFCTIFEDFTVGESLMVMELRCNTERSSKIASSFLGAVGRKNQVASETNNRSRKRAG